MYIQKVIKVGDSLAIIIPSQLRRSLEINRGDFAVVVLASEDRLVIQKIDEATAKEILSNDIHYGNKKIRV